jgi:hypothetical protein
MSLLSSSTLVIDRVFQHTWQFRDSITVIGIWLFCMFGAYQLEASDHDHKRILDFITYQMSYHCSYLSIS